MLTNGLSRSRTLPSARPRQLRIPVNVIAESCKVITESWHRDQPLEKADHSSERSDGDNSCRSLPCVEVTRHLMRAVVPLVNARRPVGRCGRRVLCAVQAGVGIASCAISTLATRSIGSFVDRRPPTMPQERRSPARPTRRYSPNGRANERTHAGAFVPRRVPGSRMVGPFRVSRCA